MILTLNAIVHVIESITSNMNICIVLVKTTCMRTNTRFHAFMPACQTNQITIFNNHILRRSSICCSKFRKHLSLAYQFAPLQKITFILGSLNPKKLHLLICTPFKPHASIQCPPTTSLNVTSSIKISRACPIHSAVL